MAGSLLTCPGSCGLGSGGRKMEEGWGGCESINPGSVTATLGPGLGQKVSWTIDANLSRHLAQPSYLLLPDLSGFLSEERQLTLSPL